MPERSLPRLRLYVYRLMRTFVAIIWLSLLALRADIALAADNPFGMPTPEANARPGCVMLHGGGKGLADEVREEFVRLAGGKDARIVLLPSDMMQRGKDAYGEPVAGGEATVAETVEAYRRRLAERANYGRWAALGTDKTIADFQFLVRDADGDPRDERFYAALENATGVWLPAHDQDWLPKLFAAEYPKTTSRFQLALRKVVARGGVVGGLGGGMACLPESIIESNEPSENGWVRAKVGFGLALLDGVVVDQNFSSWAGRLERLSDLLRNGRTLDRLGDVPGVGRRTIGLGVERHTAIILQGNSVRAIGEGRAHVFLKSNGDRTITWWTIAAGEEPLVIRSSDSRRLHEERAITGEADDFNPFGMPTPRDANKSGTVVLHGGGNTDDIIDRLPTLAGADRPRLVHCPAARESCRPSPEKTDEELRAHLERTFSPWRDLQRQGRFAELAFVTTSDASDAERKEFVEPLRRANTVWFCGGDQRPLAALLVGREKASLFQAELFEVVRRGGVVGGSSAGLAVMPEIMMESGSPENGKPAEARLARGMGVLRHVLAEQHFDARRGRIERLTGLLRDHDRLLRFSAECEPKPMIGLAVEEDTALAVRANRLSVAGKKLAHVFLQSLDSRAITWHALRPGDEAVVRAAGGDWRLELEDWEVGR
jgi:cyanophycinase